MKKISKSKSNFQLVSAYFQFRAEWKNVTSRAELKIFQLELWLEPARLGLITTTYIRRDSMLEVMCKLHDISQDFSSLINGVYFIVIIKKTALHNGNFTITIMIGFYICRSEGLSSTLAFNVRFCANKKFSDFNFLKNE